MRAVVIEYVFEFFVRYVAQKIVAVNAVFENGVVIAALNGA